MHGLGNDYVYVNTAEESVNDPARLARMVSDRHTGIGSDGLILIGGSQVADVRMEMYNADGSRGHVRQRHPLRREVRRRSRPDERAAGDGGDGFRDQVVRVPISARASGFGPRRYGRSVIESAGSAGLPSNGTGHRPSSRRRRRNLHRDLRFDGQPPCRGLHGAVASASIWSASVRCSSTPRSFPRESTSILCASIRATTSRCAPGSRGSAPPARAGPERVVCVAGATTGRTNRAITAELPGGALELDWAPDQHVYMTGPAVELYCGDWKL